MKTKRKSHMKWSWVFMMLFIILSILDIRFGVLGFVCMTVPMYHAIKGRGKVHCSHYCPRGSLLGNFLKNISMNNNLPKSFKTNTVKNIILTLMITMLAISLVHAGPDITKIGFSLFRFMMASLLVGIIMGIIFKPRSWCQVCPMGHATGLIDNVINKKSSK
ncbi:4Fe-4S binding domain-containing protein [Alkalithermobacter thermoalcaliphilus JW-YL-7 = DSM 7308]|uniref:4Fe-4S binding domain-containing protein n=1 Tax=Alkalithermobacter thermoalcaliphilus JW-YL-7 = DSM 7308 TaxID=1121328 RepID=A0A150FRL6_CLOPD|nr:4Fe-4S ferredoxin iron-sulfur binding domain-containing protein [[Clostridium] paradoxum JW-YL-7 = DSM 7308]SHK64915.1 4Fe-4S binding domain-containing protein [[Clostridium] paradoxum JW-YL-7 = DSM 7308]